MPDGTSGPPRSKRRRTGRYPTYFYDRETIERTEVVSKWNTLRTLLAIDGDTPGPSASSRSSRSPSAPLPTGPTAWSSGRQPTASNGCSMGVRSSRSKPGSAPRENGGGERGPSARRDSRTAGPPPRRSAKARGNDHRVLPDAARIGYGSKTRGEHRGLPPVSDAP